MKLQVMHKKWLVDVTTRYDEHHPESIGLADAMKAFYLQIYNWIEFMSEMDLPFLLKNGYSRKV